jgi:hypothetical protein
MTAQRSEKQSSNQEPERQDGKQCVFNYAAVHGGSRHRRFDSPIISMPRKRPELSSPDNGQSICTKTSKTGVQQVSPIQDGNIGIVAV